MQDIVFYVAAKETRGIVRDSANANTISAPNIVLGVSVCLKMRLFAACDVSTPFPIEQFIGIADWKWNMNVGFNRIGTVKLTSDPQSITVHSVTDTVDGNTMSFTEFVIPISEMNTQELEACIGNEKEWSELNAELVGYSSAGNAEFVLQIKGFTIWNRIAGLGDPAVLDQEFATRSQTVRMIQEAVSSSAATKQDLLTSANAGTNISIDENGVITNTYSLPLATTASAGGVALATAAETISGSNAVKVVTPASFKAALTGDDQIIAQSALNAFRSITDFGATLSVSLESGKAYKLSAVAGDHYLSVPDIPVGKYGMDAHLKLFVGETALVHVQDPLILMDALIPNAVNNCVIKFRDGEARMYVEDHDVGYVVNSVDGTAGTPLDGSLYYGLTGTTASYVVFANALNGQIVTLPEATTVNRSVNVVGNGYTETILTGGVSCTSKTTFSNLGMNGVSINGGTATFGDVFIPAGGTVSVSGGGLAVEKVTGAGSESVIDLSGGTRINQSGGSASYNGVALVSGNPGTNGGAIIASASATVDITSTTISGNTGANGGGLFIYNHTTANISSSIISGNRATANGGGLYTFQNRATANLTSVTVTGNTGNAGGGLAAGLYTSITLSAVVVSGNSAPSGNGGGLLALSDGAITLSDCVIANNTPSSKGIYTSSGGKIVMTGSNVLTDALAGDGTGFVTISSGAIVDLTGNANATAINPGGGITFASGGATVLVGSGTASSSYMMDNVTLPAGAKLTNTAVVDLADSNINVGAGTTATASGCVFSGGSAQNGGAFNVQNGALNLTSCIVSGNVASGFGQDIYVIFSNARINATECTLGQLTVRSSAEVVCSGGSMINTVLADGATCGLAGSVTVGRLLEYTTGRGGLVTLTSGAIIDLTGNSNATPINPGGGIVISSGGVGIIDSAGSTHEFQDLAITGSTINNLGRIFGATVSIPVSSTGVGPWIISTTLGSSTVSATAEAQEIVIDGGLVSIQEL